ncbi:MAG: DUF2231 domain-containing protein [Nitriliruptorales bacterium]
MARLFSIRPVLALKGRRFKGLRGWAGKPLHPPLTDVPVAAYVLVAILDLVSYIAGSQDSPGVARDTFVAGTWVIIAGVIVSFGAIITGIWDWWKGIERDRSTGLIGRAKHTQVWRTINWHATVMLVMTGVVIADIVVRLAQYEEAHTELPALIFSVVAAVLVSFGAMYGGSLVYDYQFNVEDLEGSTAWDESEIDQMPADKPQAGW